MKFLKPYHVKKNVGVLLAIIFVVCALLFVSLDYVKVEGRPDYVVQIVKAVQQLSLLISSIIGTNFIISLALEKENKNNAFQEFFKNDFIDSTEFKNLIPIDRQKRISDNYRNREVFKNNSILAEMSDFIEHRLCKHVGNFYYEKCEQNVSCSLDNFMIKKEINRVLEIKSYQKSCEIEKFLLLSIYTKQINGSLGCEINELKIKKTNEANFKTLDIGKYVEINIDNNIEETLKKKNGYDCLVTYRLRNPIQLTDENSFIVKISFNVVSFNNDCTSVFRLQVPCKKYILQFTSPNNYIVKPNAFGFIDRSQQALNNENPCNAKIEFDSWVFPDEGVIIEMQKKP